MSIKLAKDEKIVRTYDYATSTSKGLSGSTSTKTLVVTNKRIIHREAGHGAGNESLNTSEMPVEAAKYINTFFAKVRFPIYLVLALIFALAGVALTVAIPDVDLQSIIWIPFLLMTVLFIVIFIFKKKLTFTCTIDTDTYITPAFTFSSFSGNTATKGLGFKYAKSNKTKSVKVIVNNHIARQMADELGYVIMAVKSGDFDLNEAPVAAAKVEEVKAEAVEEVTESAE